MSTFRKHVSLVGLGLALVAGSAQAQLGVKSGGAPLGAGSSAAELDLNGSWQASLLRFGAANTAWKFSAQIDIDRVPGVNAAGNQVTNTTFNLGGSIGRRNYTGAGAFRPFMGYGASIGFGDNGATSTFGVGPYFEIGGAYFVTERFSVGAASTAGLEIQNVSPEVGDSETTIGIRGRLVSMMATVYF
jgi:hypothetical protein